MTDGTLMMSEDGGHHWMTPDVWLLWVMKNEPWRIKDQTKEPEPADPRAEARQFRAGRAQGLLARTSPLRAERARRQTR
jgi:hypothetical protein